MNKFNLFYEGLQDAQQTQRAADANANRMAEMLVGRLRHVRGIHLEKLKRELRDFNIQTHRWKE